MASGEDIVRMAKKSLGVPYVWGGNSLSSGVDCSGLVQQVFKRFGITVPRVTYDQINVGAKVSIKKLRPGDLVFFDTDRSRRGPDHVGIYMGGGKFIHAPRPGSSVKISSLGDSYYQSRWMGGRRMSGVKAGPGGGGGYAEEPEPRLSSSELAERYGMSYAFFKSEGELMKLLKKATSGQWSADKWQAELRNTKWWKKNSSSVRKAKVLAKSDPATYRATLEAARVAARQAAVQTGAILSQKRVDDLAKKIVDYEWDEAAVANYLGKYVDFYKKGVAGGIAGRAASEIRSLAFDLGTSVTEQSVLNNAQYLVRGLTTMERIEANMREDAAGLYPAFAEQIKAGASMQEIAQPYISMLAGELGLPETDVSAASPKIKRALNRVSADGRPEPMTLHDFQRLVRQDDRWRKNAATREMTMSAGRQVLADMGLMAGGPQQ